jgi:hypothetical protein
MLRTRLTRFIVQATLWASAGLLFLSACSAGGSPAIDAARGWLQALADLNFKQVLELTCSNPQARTQVELRLDPLIDMQETLQALKGKFDFSGLKFEELRNNDRTAVVRLSGKMFLQALGQEQALDIYEEITLIRESGEWKVCGNAANLLKF